MTGFIGTRVQCPLFHKALLDVVGLGAVRFPLSLWDSVHAQVVQTRFPSQPDLRSSIRPSLPLAKIARREWIDSAVTGQIHSNELSD